MAKKKNNVLKNIIIGASLLVLVVGGVSAIKSCSEDKMPNIEDVLGGTSEDTSKDDNSTSEDENTSTDDGEFVSQYHFTIVGTMNEWDVLNNDYLFTTTDDITFTLNADLPMSAEWKIANDNAWNWQYGYDNLDTASHTYTNNVDGNIKMIVSGNYNITLNIQLHTINLTYVKSLEEASTSTISILSPIDELLMSIDISDGMTWEDLDNELGSNYLTCVNGTNYELVIDDNGVGLGSVQGNTPDNMYEHYCFYIRTLNDDGTSTLVKPTDTISSDLSYKIFTSLTGE